MVGTLFLIRHGATEGSGVKRYKGSLDVPLSEEGIAQVERTAKFLASQLNGPLEAVYSSTLIRAVRSAEAIARRHGLEPVAVEGLRERSFGLWEGMSFEEIRAQYPAEFDAWARDPLRFSPVGGESTLEVRDRVMKALGDVLDRHDGGGIAVVGHGGVNRVILCHYLGVPLENIFRIEQDFACLNVIHFYDGYPVVRLVNGVAP